MERVQITQISILAPLAQRLNSQTHYPIETYMTIGTDYGQAFHVLHLRAICRDKIQRHISSMTHE